MSTRILLMCRVLTILYLVAVIFGAFRFFPGGTSTFLNSGVNLFCVLLIVPLFPLWRWINRNYRITPPEESNEEKWVRQSIGLDPGEQIKKRKHKTT
jgi:hypothetical protein